MSDQSSENPANNPLAAPAPPPTASPPSLHPSSPPSSLPSSPVWTRLQRRLHWGVAAVVLVQFLTQDVMREAMKLVAVDRAPGFGAFMILTLHVWGGATAGCLVLWRIRLRRAGRLQIRPLAAHLNHAVLYLLLVMMSVSGALHYGAGVAGAARWHVVGKWLLVGAVCLHLAGSLWHTVVKRDRVLASMMGRGDDH